MTLQSEESSFRDRDGFVFYAQNKVYRAIGSGYAAQWSDVANQNFLKELIHQGKVVGFSDVPQTDLPALPPAAEKIIEVHRIPFVSYPCEWTFGQLKKAALLTLTIQKQALENGFTLKDASAYNVQFRANNPVFIDLFSFEKYQEGEPWMAYGQFCRHFLGPLLLNRYCGVNLQQLFVTSLDGVSLATVSKLLPWHTRFSPLCYTHIHLHARFENQHAADAGVKKNNLRISRKRSLAIIEHLYEGISALKLPGSKTNWTDYYDTFSYSKDGYAAKREFVEKHVSPGGGLCVDLGANTGEFSAMAASHFKYVVACDNDREVVRAIATKKLPNVLALYTDLSNPTPAFGWNSKERQSFISRVGEADAVLALALVHHLCIGNNVPLHKLAVFFAGFAKKLIVEFVPKTDIQVKKLLVTRKDIFDDYTAAEFERQFTMHYTVEAKLNVPGSERVLYSLLKKQHV